MGIKFEQQGQGQPENLSEQEGAAKTQEQPTGFTEAQLQQIGQIVGQSLEGCSRQQQSQRDKLEARISKQVEQNLSAARGAGIELTPEQEKAIENQTRKQFANSQDDSQQEPAQAPNGDQTNNQQEGTDPLAAAVNAEVDALYKNYGFELDEGYPEAQGIDKSTPFKFVQSVERALQAKQARVESEGGALKPPSTNTFTGTGNNAPGNRIANIKDPDLLLEMGLKKK